MAAPAPDRGRRLGRGLDFLLAAPEATKSGPAAQVEIETERVRSNPWQPRKSFDESALATLTESIRQHGVIQPISVRAKGEEYELIAGERRLLAARRAGLSRIPAVVRGLDDAQMLQVALVENLQREDLNPVDRAIALKRLVEEHGKSHDEVAAIAGLARSTVTNSIRLLELDDATIDALRNRSITEGHARALLGQPDMGRRQAILRMVVDKQLNVRQTELEAAAVAPTARPAGRAPSEDSKRLAKQLAEALRTKVRVLERGTRGRIVVHYSSLQEFERLFTALAGRPPPVE